MAFEKPPYVPDWAEPERSPAVVQKRESCHGYEISQKAPCPVCGGGTAWPPKDPADQATDLVRQSGLGPRRLAILVFLNVLRRERDPRRAYQAARFAAVLAKRPTSEERRG